MPKTIELFIALLALCKRGNRSFKKDGQEQFALLKEQIALSPSKNERFTWCVGCCCPTGTFRGRKKKYVLQNTGGPPVAHLPPPLFAGLIFLHHILTENDVPLLFATVFVYC